eukprot:contig_16289_g3944
MGTRGPTVVPIGEHDADRPRPTVVDDPGYADRRPRWPCVSIPLFLTACILRSALTHPRRQHGIGRVRTKTVKKSARVIIEKYYSRLTLDFQTNKRICDEVAIIPSKRLRNKIAGFVTVRR